MNAFKEIVRIQKVNPADKLGIWLSYDFIMKYEEILDIVGISKTNKDFKKPYSKENLIKVIMGTIFTKFRQT